MLFRSVILLFLPLVFLWFSLSFAKHIHIGRMFDVCISNKKTLINLKHFVTSWCIKIWNFEKMESFVCASVCVCVFFLLLLFCGRSHRILSCTYFNYMQYVSNIQTHATCQSRWWFHFRVFFSSVFWLCGFFRFGARFSGIYNLMQFIWFSYCNRTHTHTQ